jgi:hypothetical protein
MAAVRQACDLCWGAGERREAEEKKKKDKRDRSRSRSRGRKDKDERKSKDKDKDKENSRDKKKSYESNSVDVPGDRHDRNGDKPDKRSSPSRDDGAQRRRRYILRYHPYPAHPPGRCPTPMPPCPA